jgi:4-diphosphocytidyl-2-C-methyl-D-erythritol kinase
MIFEADHSRSTNAITGVRHFRSSAHRLFSILHDPASWEQPILPRMVSASAPTKIVYSFAGTERATLELVPWNSEICQLNITVDGVKDGDSSNRQISYWSQIIDTVAQRLQSQDLVVASSPGKVNIYFAVGAFLKDGYHTVASCYQALTLREQVLVEQAASLEIEFCGPFKSESEKLVPKDNSNLVYKAGEVLRSRGMLQDPSQVRFLIHKSVPIAGGMAGGSADAAAALLALNKLFDAGLEGEMLSAATHLGADVPFSLTGGMAVGLGKGERLTEVDQVGVLHWVITPSELGLSTPDVYRKLDTMRVEEGIDVSKLEEPTVPEELLKAAASGDAKALAPLMQNDLERAALALRPELINTISAGHRFGSLRSMVSGSGPSIAHLVADRVAAELLVARLNRAGFPSIATYTTRSGTRLEG